jgi:hypothetical protein
MLYDLRHSRAFGSGAKLADEVIELKADGWIVDIDHPSCLPHAAHSRSPIDDEEQGRKTTQAPFFLGRS